MTQSERVLELLRSHPDGLTALQCLHWGGGMRLAARIADLEKAGYVIDHGRVEGTNYARYRIVEKPVELELGL